MDRLDKGKSDWSAPRGVSWNENALDDARASEALLAEAQRIARMGSWSWDVGSDSVNWSDELHRIFGRPKGEGPASFEEYIGAVHPEDRARVQAAVENVLATARAHEHDYRIVHPSGDTRWMHARIEVMATREARPARLGGYCQDITEQRLAEIRTRSAQSDLVSYQRVLEHIARGHPLASTLDLICGDIEKQCPGTRCSVLLADVVNGSLHHIAAPSLPPSFARAIDGLPIAKGSGACGTAAATRQVVVVEDTLHSELTRSFVDLAAEHELRSVWSSPLLASGGELIGTFALYRTTCHTPDQCELELVTTAGYLAALALERHLAEERFVRAMQVDPLTDLPNRTRFMALVETRLGRVSRDVAVMFLDIDGFKWINDGHGHAVGDRVLTEVAGRLARLLGEHHVLARFGGDEFTILIEEASPECIGTIAGLVQDAFSRPFRVESSEYFLSVSAGTAVADHSSSAPDLIRDADTAMYSAKEVGHFSHVVFDSSLRNRALSRIKLEAELRQAIDRDEFVIHLQPVLDLQSGRWVSAEALVRWAHPERGLVYPDSFIPFAEEIGLIGPLGYRVLEQAVPVAGLLWRGGLGIKVAVNLSVMQLTDDLADRLAQILQSDGVPPDALILEVTESAVMERGSVAHSVLESVAALGIEIVLDDFGTGYSSIARLGDLPVAGIKIDGSFTQKVSHDEGAPRVLAAIVDLAHAVNLRSVAEGIETAEALSLLRHLGCEFGQGYYLARPVPLDDLLAILAEPPACWAAPPNAPVVPRRRGPRNRRDSSPQLSDL